MQHSEECRRERGFLWQEDLPTPRSARSLQQALFMCKRRTEVKQVAGSVQDWRHVHNDRASYHFCRGQRHKQSTKGYDAEVKQAGNLPWTIRR